LSLTAVRRAATSARWPSVVSASRACGSRAGPRAPRRFAPPSAP